MKRWQVTETERKVLDHVLSEYLGARTGRTEALAAIESVKGKGDLTSQFSLSLTRERLAANRATVALCSELTHLLRRF
jgi:hypothetical protein